MKHSQRIFIISDIDWNPTSKDISLDDIQSFEVSKIIPEKDSFNSIHYLAGLIEEFKPDTVLFPGDVTGDGSCGHGFHLAFLYLLKYLESKSIYGLFTRGNHDSDISFSFVTSNIRKSKFIYDVSLINRNINGVNYFGIPFQSSKYKATLKQLIKEAKHIDILLCHAELKSRAFLFDFPTSIICTGHFDNKLCYIDEKLFISLFNQFPLKNYCLLDFKTSEDYKVEYFYETKGKTIYLYNEEAKEKSKIGEVKDSFLIVSGEKHKGTFKITDAISKDSKSNKSLLKTNEVQNINNEEYRFVMEKILKVKRKSEMFLTQSDLNTMTKLWAGNYKISETMILNYIGKGKIKTIV